MEEEFNLSKKRMERVSDTYYVEEDVKEFIRRLKENFTNNMKRRNLRAMKTTLGEFNYEIDKLAGDKLK